MSDDGGESTNELYHPPPPPKVKKEPKKARVKKKSLVEIVTDLEEWERLLREVPLKSGGLRFYRGKTVAISFQ